jgi:hypothetical protein
LSHFRWFIVILVLGLGWFAPRLGDPILNACERFAARFAKRKVLTVCTVALAAILTRLALLSVFPAPVPGIHDEFSYLLAGDTFAHARLTNPPHPMWFFFDTFHVLQHPTYQSIYPPAQGAVLALGILLGRPWIGVLLSIAAMCAAITWMLQGWFPAKWALLGAVFAVVRLDLCSYWTDSYWGGAVAAMGASLVLGALPRIVHQRRARNAIIMGIGAGLLANSRPVEGFVFCLPVAAVLIAWLLSARGPTLAQALPRVVAPFLCVLGLTLVFMGYYNWRVTGSVTRFPHVLDRFEYQAVPTFIWQAIPAVRHYSNPQFESFYNSAVRSHIVSGISWSLGQEIWNRCTWWWVFFLGRALSLPFVTLPWLLRDRRTRLPLVQSAICAAGLMIGSYFEPHYAAPMAAAFFLLLMQAMRHLRRWEVKDRSIGIFLTRLVVLLALAHIGMATLKQAKNPIINWGGERVRVAAQLKSLPGNHLVIVRYTPEHHADYEWVYNAADIDRSRIVWAREVPGQDLKPLLDYYHDRKVWVVEADMIPAKVEPYRAGSE